MYERQLSSQQQQMIWLTDSISLVNLVRFGLGYIAVVKQNDGELQAEGLATAA